MKKLNLGKLKLHSDEIMEKGQMATVYGGASFTCYCGATGGSGEGYPFNVTADSEEDAKNKAAAECHGMGATCSG
ncbi:hypothetical protein LV84_04290 [Algoriphagus ratkowskyi]|uniref:Natural product n=1 Tax=Algoriphagus ratkowskyi TaxID=57028 RepID=A0A2W7SEK2_9BACT|nr:hypothetical protein [Algoriphagus ratkowskyi]PZX49102.1 hypothetical protein LV84_04290 [Algoriphagus ratkowskyi]TXD75339.1 hypothetical protein ESW18_20885 [Algoriphagus ratkowskyi]